MRKPLDLSMGDSRATSTRILCRTTAVLAQNLPRECDVETLKTAKSGKSEKQYDVQFGKLTGVLESGGYWAQYPWAQKSYTTSGLRRMLVSSSPAQRILGRSPSE
jgi:hypothetical protein